MEKQIKINVSYERTINIGNYENLKPRAEYEETVIISSIEERDAAYKKAWAIVRNQVNYCINDFYERNNGVG